MPPATYDPHDEKLLALVRATGHDPGGRVDEADIRVALRILGHDPGAVINDGDIAVLGEITGPTFHTDRFGPEAPRLEQVAAPPAQTGSEPVQTAEEIAGATPDTPATDPSELTEDQRNAKELLAAVLRDYDLEALLPWVEEQIRDGASNDVILVRLREQDAYKDRFAGIDLLRERHPDAVVPTEREYLQYEKQARDMMRLANMPEGFYDDRSDFAELIGNNISINNLAARINRGYEAVAKAPREVRDIFAEFYGPNGDAALAAFFLAPEKQEGEILRDVEVAEVGGQARRFGFELGLTRSTRIQTLGLSSVQREGAFTQVRRQKPIFQETIREATDLTAETTGINAAFNLDTTSEDQILKRLESRVARFSGSSGGAAMTGTGVIGLGSASDV